MALLLAGLIGLLLKVLTALSAVDIVIIMFMSAIFLMVLKLYCAVSEIEYYNGGK